MGTIEQEFTQLRGRIIELEDQVKFLYKHLGITFEADSSNTYDPRIIEQIEKGNLIEAIKLHRQSYNTDLAEAKAAVEALKSKLGAR